MQKLNLFNIKILTKNFNTKYIQTCSIVHDNIHDFRAKFIRHNLMLNYFIHFSFGENIFVLWYASWHISHLLITAWEISYFLRHQELIIRNNRYKISQNIWMSLFISVCGALNNEYPWDWIREHSAFLYLIKLIVLYLYWNIYL